MRTLIILLFILSSVCASAQTERGLVREGNELYKEKKFSDAETKYRKSLEKNKESQTAAFNLGDAYYKQNKYADAEKQFQTIASDKNASKAEQSRALHNLGNAYLKEKKFQESIDAYKNALKVNPKDNDTRYNLAYAQSMLQQQQQQQKKDDKKDNKDQKEQKEQQVKKEDKKQNEEQKQAQQKQQISKEDAEKILEALNNDERNTQKKFVKKETTRIQIDKQW